MAAPHHRLHGEAVDTGVGPDLPHTREHGLHGILHRGGVVEVQRHAANVGLVRDIGRQDFQDHRKPDGLGGVDGSQRLRADAAGGHHGNAVGAEHRLGLGLGEHLAAFGQYLLHQRVHGGRVGAVAR